MKAAAVLGENIAGATYLVVIAITMVMDSVTLLLVDVKFVVKKGPSAVSGKPTKGALIIEE